MNNPSVLPGRATLLSLVVTWLLSATLSADAPRDLRATPVPNALGLRLNEFALSWSDPEQESFQVLVASDAGKLAADVGDLWDSGRRFTSRSEGIVCRGKAFSDGAVVWWKVRIWNERSESSAYSAPARIKVSAVSNVSPRRRPTHPGDGELEFVEGRIGRALRLGVDRPTVRTDDYDGLRSTRGTTISAWIRPTRVTKAWQCIYRKEDGSDRRVLAIGEEGPFWGLWCGFSVGGRYVEFGAPLDSSRLVDGAWHHVAVTLDGRHIRLFVDGTKRAEETRPGSIGGGGTAPAFIGSYGGDQELFEGDIDDVRVYTRGLTEQGVRKLADGDRKVSNQSLAGWWRLDDTIANEVTFTPERRTDRVVLVGGSLMADMERYGFFETAVTARWPHHDITFRNLGWPADDVFGTARGEFESARGPGTWRPEGGDSGAGYGELLAQVRAAKPTTLIVGYGAEAAYAETEEQMRNFQAGYLHLVKDLEGTGARLILVTPVPQGKAVPQGKTGEPVDPIVVRNTRLKRAAAFIVELARDREHLAIGLHECSFEDSAYYRTAVALSDDGHRHVGTLLAGALGVNAKAEVAHSEAATSIRGEGLRADGVRHTDYGARFSLTLDQLPSVACAVDLGGHQGLYHNGELIGHSSKRFGTGAIERGPDVDQAEELRRLIIQKNGYHRAKLRPLNKTYIFLFRRHEMGHFAREMGEYDDLVRGAEEQIALLRVPRTHRHVFRAARNWSAPRRYPDHEVPKKIPRPNVEEELAAFKVAEGFKVNLFASNPMVANPINLNWDVRGRAWVSTSSTYPHPRPGERPNDRIVILEDRDRDGVADHHVVFAEGLLVPHSVIPVAGGAYVCSATELLFLADADGDDVSESRRVVFSGFGNADVHHMIHGLRWAPWGDLHFIQSIYINSFVDTPHGPRRMNGSGVWHFRPETGRLEPFATGMVNPWGFAFDRWGQSFGTDGAAGQGPHYVFPGSAFRSAVGAHRVLDGLIRGKPNNTGAEFVSGRHLPDHWQGSLLGNDFRANRTVRYELQPNGSGYSAKEVETVLHSAHRSFRPVDVKMGPDGAIYVVDWYNAIIDHGEVDFYHPLRDKSHGRIWRITATGRPLVDPPAIVGAKVDDLLELLTAPEPYTRNQTRRELASRPFEGISKTLFAWVKNLDPTDPQFENHRLEALWVFMVHRAAPADLLEAVLQSPSAQVRAAAARAVANMDSARPRGRDAQTAANKKIDPIALLARAVEDKHPQVRLEAVNGLRSLGSLEAADVALRARSHPTDDNLNFALELTVRQLRDRWLPALQSGKRVFDGDPGRLAYALEKVGDSRAISRLLRLVTTGAIDAETLPQAVATIAALGEPGDLESVLGMANRNPALLSAIARGAADNSHVPPNAEDVLGFLAADDTGVVMAATELAGIWKVTASQPRLIAIASGPQSAGGPLLESACRALGRLGSTAELERLGAAGRSPMLRAHALAAWARIDPDEAARPAVSLLSTLDAPAQSALTALTALTIDAFLAHARGPAALRAALEGATLKKTIAIAGLRRIRASGRDMRTLIAALEKAANLEPLSQILSVDQRRAILRDIPELGDVARGREIFEREPLGCTTCHLVDNRGGSVGPDLTTVGTYATPESLLESLANPSTTIKQGYETVVVVKKNGTVVAGLLERKTGTATLVRDAEGKVIAIRTSDIVAIDRSPVSLMPPGLTASLRRDELIDLTRFLTSLGKGAR